MGCGILTLRIGSGHLGALRAQPKVSLLLTMIFLFTYFFYCLTGSCCDSQPGVGSLRSRYPVSSAGSVPMGTGVLGAQESLRSDFTSRNSLLLDSILSDSLRPDSALREALRSGSASGDSLRFGAASRDPGSSVSELRSPESVSRDSPALWSSLSSGSSLMDRLRPSISKRDPSSLGAAEENTVGPVSDPKDTLHWQEASKDPLSSGFALKESPHSDWRPPGYVPLDSLRSDSDPLRSAPVGRTHILAAEDTQQADSSDSLESQYKGIPGHTRAQNGTNPYPAPSPGAISIHNSFGTKRFPQAIIVGVKKGGTRALLEFLRVHPDVRALGAEPHFFDRCYDKGLEWYRNLMPRTFEGQITMEKTPSYFVTMEAPKRIYNMSSDTKLIVVVRNPVTRAISDYTQTLSKTPSLPSFQALAFKNTSGPIDTSWSAIRIGIYAKHLDNWLQYFPLSKFLFVSGERLVSDPAGEMGRVQDFLGLKRVITDKHFYFNETKGFPCLKKPEGSSKPRCLGKSKGRPHPNIDTKVLQRLQEFYRPYNQKFYQMTGQDFGWD
ncbi:hypothetical protein XENTR_v10023827 [Xenopus tropicalis]|uniref:Sulfotransferase n=1 Tax=Xenopus tropicalis TaxID=8364 RepID=F7BIT7_XENTR|nr:heparan sulfate glucosamine 3-O-sulfotransferase 6 [Xenopus tropicalis]KAE8578919.1 hypothetical protein XENTR_v10023827 [Xenopus tropicalis]